MNRYLSILSSLLAVGAIFYYFDDVLTWVVLAWVISLLGSPIMKLLGRLSIGTWQLSSSLRAVMVLALFYGAFGLFMYMFIPVLMQQARNLAGVNYTSIMASLDEPLSRTSDWLVEHKLMQGDFSKYYVHTDSSTQKPVAPKPKLPAENIGTVLPQGGDSLRSDSLRQLPDSLRSDSGAAAANTVVSIVPPAPDSTGKIQVRLPLDSAIAQARNRRDAQGNTVIQLQIVLPNNKADTTPVVNPDDSRSAFNALRDQVVSYFDVSSLVTKTAAYLLSILSTILILVSSVTFIAFFFLKDEELFGRGIKAAIPNKHMEKVDTALHQIKRMLTRYFGGILLQIMLITIYMSIALSFFGIKNAVLIAFFAALINVIPYIGPILGAIFGLIVTLGANVEADFYSVTLPMLVQVAVIFVSMQALDNFLLQPVIFSNSVMAHPLEIFIVVIAGAKFGGVLGMVVAIPIYTIIRVIASVFLNEFKLVQKLTRQMNEQQDENP